MYASLVGSEKLNALARNLLVINVIQLVVLAFILRDRTVTTIRYPLER